MVRFRPSLHEYFPLDDEHVRTEYLKRKAARLATEPVNDHRRVIYREHLSTQTIKAFSVWGDSATYAVCLLPGTNPWMAACSRGGVHDLQPHGQACAHGVAAAAVWKLLTEPMRCKNCSESYDPMDLSDPDYGPFVGPRYCGPCGATEARMLAVDLGVEP
jgi:hypothetical protein